MSIGVIKVIVTEHSTSNRPYNKITFTGRLIGIASAEDMKAIANTKDAGRKLFSSESVGLDSLNSGYDAKSRIVMATTRLNDKVGRAVYISPPIKFCGWESGKKKYYCADETEVLMEEI